jgi:hypothetical protein
VATNNDHNGGKEKVLKSFFGALNFVCSKTFLIKEPMYDASFVIRLEPCAFFAIRLLETGRIVGLRSIRGESYSSL